MSEDKLSSYARLVVKTGVNLQPDQTLVINAPIECAPFARAIAQSAYETGAHDVVINWKDELFAKVRYMHAPEMVFDEFPAWQKEFYLSNVRQGAAFVSIAAADPELLKDVDGNRVVRQQKAANTALKDYRERLMSNRNTWCVVSVPTVAWAKKVFPELEDAEAVSRLQQAIYQTIRLDLADPVAAWTEHIARLKQRTEFMNSRKFKLLRYQNDLGTKLEVELPEGHIWLGGSERTPDGINFVANMPTEEIFTLPKRDGVNGVVHSSKPLNYNGNLIEQFSLTLKAGRIVDFKASKGQEILGNLIHSDEGSNFLGEVALVPFDSPISNSNILFYNTLFDENASCHLAIGKAYPVCIENGENMSADELAAHQVNDSLVHEDFMLGTADLEITGVTHDGREVPVFRQGNFAF